MKKWVTLEKEVGQTPLVCAEEWRAEHPQYEGVPLAYAGRLDPMASGKLLILIGEECKNQTNYHGLDKEYEFSVLFGIESDSLDVLGRLESCHNQSPDWVRLGQTAKTAKSGNAEAVKKTVSKQLTAIAKRYVGPIELPYPKFSSKTVKGKPLHTWTLENRLDEISIPTNKSTIYSLTLNSIDAIRKETLVEKALEKVNSIPKVTDPRKIIGNDFRRADVRADWQKIEDNEYIPETFTIANFSCIASSGTYMRSLASEIARNLNTYGFAWRIHRTHIGKYNPETKSWDLEY